MVAVVVVRGVTLGARATAAAAAWRLGGLLGRHGGGQLSGHLGLLGLEGGGGGVGLGQVGGLTGLVGPVLVLAGLEGGLLGLELAAGRCAAGPSGW